MRILIDVLLYLIAFFNFSFADTKIEETENDWNSSLSAVARFLRVKWIFWIYLSVIWLDKDTWKVFSTEELNNKRREKKKKEEKGKVSICGLFWKTASKTTNKHEKKTKQANTMLPVCKAMVYYIIIDSSLPILKWNSVIILKYIYRFPKTSTQRWFVNIQLAQWRQMTKKEEKPFGILHKDWPATSVYSWHEN